MAIFVLTADEFLSFGLKQVGFPCARQNVSRDTNLARFNSHFGANPNVFAEMWVDFQLTPMESAHIPRKELKLNYFFMTLYFLKCYPREAQLCGMFNVSEKTARKWIRFYITKIEALKAQKITFPENLGDDASFDCVMSVDGTHCPIDEPSHPTLSKDPTYYSHKLNHAGLAYEIGLSLVESRIVWVNGPFPASMSDISIFRGTLKNLLPAGKLVIADRGYRNEPAVICYSNAADPDHINLFKRRARSRHETINSKIKTFSILKEQYHHHNIEFHGSVFHAICVICQYKLDNGGFLFPIVE